uniref:Uncharacterized protein n=1 Tax=Strombidium rassoulzadegani TaxID=1082188 RepID=A0A7S3FXR9_9SPIT|mmetsp:Transcript_17876/g.30377  ORF Transcript_17876/g.30377 Transcript_17876/m.30377 type:complete len:100 (+) Transcript_17876:35-334(+)
MVKTSYPTMWRYVNKWTIIAYGFFFLIPIQFSFYHAHLNWKRGKQPRLTHNDQLLMKYVNASGYRQKMLQIPALEWQQDQFNAQHQRSIRKFIRANAGN